jgi:hypothetical protein
MFAIVGVEQPGVATAAWKIDRAATTMQFRQVEAFSTWSADVC